MKNSFDIIGHDISYEALSTAFQKEYKIKTTDAKILRMTQKPTAIVMVEVMILPVSNNAHRKKFVLIWSL